MAKINSALFAGKIGQSALFTSFDRSCGGVFEPPRREDAKVLVGRAVRVRGYTGACPLPTRATGPGYISTLRTRVHPQGCFPNLHQIARLQLHAAGDLRAIHLRAVAAA